MVDNICEPEAPDDGVIDNQDSGGEERGGFQVHSSVRRDGSGGGSGRSDGGGWRIRRSCQCSRCGAVVQVWAQLLW